MAPKEPRDRERQPEAGLFLVSDKAPPQEWRATRAMRRSQRETDWVRSDQAELGLKGHRGQSQKNSDRRKPSRFTHASAAKSIAADRTARPSASTTRSKS